MNLFNINCGFRRLNLFATSNIWNPLRNIALQKAIHIWFGTEDSDYLFQACINISIICINISFEYTIFKEDIE